MAKRGLGISVEDKGIAKIIQHNKLIVPSNQRPYAWEEDHIRTLFEDFSSAISNKSDTYFLGTIVLTQGDEESRLEVADGQQRLATTSILIAAIRDYLISTKGTNEGKAANKYTAAFLLEFDEKTGESTPKLKLNYEDNDYFLKRVLLEPQENERLKSKPRLQSHERLNRAAELAKSHVEKVVSQFASADKSKNLYDWIGFLEESALVIQIRVPADVDAFTMFETLNDRGLRASQTDILKNYLFKNAKDRLAEIQVKWASMSSTIESVGDSDLMLQYLRHFWTLKYGYVVERDLAAQVKEKINNRQDAVNMIVDLESRAFDYTGLLSPLEYSGWPPHVDMNSRGYIYVITRILEIEQIMPLLMAIIENFDQAQLKKALRLLLASSVRFMIAGAGGGGPLNHAYGQAAKEVMDGKIKKSDELRTQIGAGILRTDAEFKEAFSKAKASKNDLARYYLRALEIKAQGGSNPELGNILEDEKTLNLEHIMPQSSSSDWSISDDVRQQYKKRLGNLALLNPSSNVKIGNSAFTEKKKVFATEDHLLTKDVAKFDEWGPQQIEKRQETLAELAAQVWQI